MAAQVHVKTEAFDKFAAVLGAKTQTDKAALLGLDLSVVTRIWNGQRGPSQMFIAATLNAFPSLDFLDLFEIRDDVESEAA